MIIIDYPYEHKKPKLPNLFIGKPEHPLNEPIRPFNIKEIPDKDTKSNNNGNNELSNTINEEYEKKNNNKNAYLESAHLKSDDSENTTESNLQKKSAIINTNFNTIIDPEINAIKHFNTQNQKCHTQSKLLNNKLFQNLPIKDKKMSGYCIYCEEVYKKCGLDNNNLPLNKTCINCERPICNETLELYKNNKAIEQDSSKPKTTRNKQTNQPNLGTIAKSFAIAKIKEAALKASKLELNHNNSNNSSFIKEKDLFKKKYSFLQLHNQSVNSIKKEQEKSINKTETFKEGLNLKKAHSKKHIPMKLTISLSEVKGKQIHKKEWKDYMKIQTK